MLYYQFTKPSNKTVQIQNLEVNNKYLYSTSQGYPIFTLFADKKDNRMHIICKRPKGDYVVGIGYDIDKGVWGQGRYDFPTYKKALRSLKRDYKIILIKIKNETPYKEWKTYHNFIASNEDEIVEFFRDNRLPNDHAWSFDGYTHIADVSWVNNVYTYLSPEKINSLGQIMTVKEALDLWWNSVRIIYKKQQLILYKTFEGDYELDEEMTPYGVNILNCKIKISRRPFYDLDGYPYVLATLIEKGGE